MPENIRHLFEQGLPFIVAANQGQGPQLNIPRILEAVIIAAVLGLGAWAFLIPELKLQFEYMQRDVHKISEQVETIQKDVNQLKLDAAVEKARHAKD